MLLLLTAIIPCLPATGWTAAAPGTILWQQPLTNNNAPPEWLESAPAVGPDGTVIVGSLDKHLYMVSNDGSRISSLAINEEISAPPTIAADGTVYVGTFTGTLLAVNRDGTIRWRLTLNPKYSIIGSPVISPDGTLFIGEACDQTNESCPDPIHLYGISPAGTLRWSTEVTDGLTAAPVLDTNGTIYIGSLDNTFRAISQEGTELWRYTVSQSDPLHDGIQSAAAITSSGQLVFGTNDKTVLSLSPEGALNWSYTGNGWFTTSPVIAADGTIYVVSWDGTVTALTTTGQKKWEVPLNSPVTRTTPALDAAGTLYVGDASGTLTAISPAGEKLWSTLLRDAQGNDAGEINALVIDHQGTIFCSTSSGTLFAVAGSPGDPATIHQWPMLQKDSRHSGSLYRIPGDLNRDGRVELTDALLLSRLLTGQPVTQDITLYDVDGDGKSGTPELLFLLRTLSAP